MRALKRFAELALADKEHTAKIAELSDVADRWATIKPYLTELNMGKELVGDIFAFRNKAHIMTLICRLNDQIEDAERQQRLASKNVYASWLAASSALVSALTALVALLCSLV